MGQMSPQALLYIWLLGISTFSTAQSLNQIPLQPPPVSQSEWDDLKYQVGGRLFRSAPFAEPCFSRPFPSPSCVEVQAAYVNEGQPILKPFPLCVLKVPRISCEYDIGIHPESMGDLSSYGGAMSPRLYQSQE